MALQGLSESLHSQCKRHALIRWIGHDVSCRDASIQSRGPPVVPIVWIAGLEPWISESSTIRGAPREWRLRARWSANAAGATSSDVQLDLGACPPLRRLVFKTGDEGTARWPAQLTVESGQAPLRVVKMTSVQRFGEGLERQSSRRRDVMGTMLVVDGQRFPCLTPEPAGGAARGEQRLPGRGRLGGAPATAL